MPDRILPHLRYFAQGAVETCARIPGYYPRLEAGAILGQRDHRYPRIAETAVFYGVVGSSGSTELSESAENLPRSCPAQ